MSLVILLSYVIYIIFIEIFVFKKLDTSDIDFVDQFCGPEKDRFIGSEAKTKRT